MKKYILLAFSCFILSQANALGKLTIINGTNDYNLLVQPIAANTTNCYPQLSTYALLVNNYYLQLSPNQSLSYDNFTDFDSYPSGVKFVYRDNASSPGVSLTTLQAQNLYANQVEWSKFIFKSFHQITDVFGVGSHIGLPSSFSCHNDPTSASYEGDTDNTVATTFTIGTHTYFIINQYS